MSIARYTYFVSLSKRLLMIFVFVMIGILIWIASGGTGVNGARMVFSNIAKSENVKNIMTKPRYQGVDAHNRPFTVIVEKATQLDKENVALDNIHADMIMSNGTWVAIEAKAGTFGLTNKKLELHDGMDVFYGEGYEFRTDHANIDIQQGNAYGDAPVQGQGPGGTLKADNFAIYNHGQKIVFTGSVKMTLYH